MGANKHQCGSGSTCENTIGGYNCLCQPGFRLQGYDCVGKSISFNCTIVYCHMAHKTVLG